ncbi:MAG: VOC family protein [Tannerella sp.]|jgi:catechol 2,3-dioxygenase-like lactoylglutathione lyase family enzyme|nr:VOC family protein [Tannerella sp.]
MDSVICGIQQVGIGVADMKEAFGWYIKAFGCDIKILEDDKPAERMLPYTGGKPQPKQAILAINLRGGGGFEIWQPKGRALKYPAEKPRPGDVGIFACKIKSSDIERSYHHLKQLQGANLLGGIEENPAGKKHFFLYDPYENLFDVEEDDYVFSKTDKPTGGVNGVTIGVTDPDRSANFYSKLLGYDMVEYDESGIFADLKNIYGGEKRLRRMMIKPSAPMQGPLCEIMGTSHIELIQSPDIQPVRLYENRWWGDPGFIHLCFDIRHMAGIKKKAEALGHPFVCDSGADFRMGEAGGHFTYVEDPDGTLIEFVETFKIPVLKKLGIYLHLKNKDDRKPLPRYITKALRFLKVKDI